MSKTWDDNTFPLAYLVTFRTYGTWLHGDKEVRSAVARIDMEVLGCQKIQ